MSVGFSAQLARYVAEHGSVDVPAAAVDAVKELFVDTIGVAFAGAVEPSGRMVTSVVRAQGGVPLATVIGSGERSSAMGAALANGAAAHALDLDDSHHPGFLHPSAVLMSAVLALAEERHARGADAIAAYLFGLDTVTAVGSAINLRHYELGWHATATIGTLAAAVAGARVLDLDATETEAAVGIGASCAGGVRRNFGSPTKPLHAGLAASRGVLAALLAHEGVTAGDAVLEGEQGFFDLFAGVGEWDAPAGLAVLDGTFSAATTGLGIKRFASCGVTHTPIEAALALRAAHAFDADDVVEVELTVDPLAAEIATHHEPRNGLEAKFSLEHCVAVALREGRVGLDAFDDALVRAPLVDALRRRVRLATDPAVGDDSHRSFGSRLTVTLADGRRLTNAVPRARGKFVGERLAYAEIVEKYDGCMAAAGVTEETTARIRAVVESLDELPDVALLGDAIREAAAVTA